MDQELLAYYRHMAETSTGEAHTYWGRMFHTYKSGTVTLL